LETYKKQTLFNILISRHIPDTLLKAIVDISSRNTEECYIKIPKSVVMSEQNEQSVKWWQREWTETTKGAITKAFFPKIEERLKFRINVTPNFTAIVTAHGNIKAY